MMYKNNMKYAWSPEKNEWLKKERNISFEQIIFHLSQGDIWKTADHPDQEKYPDQMIYFVIVDGYSYLIPYVQTSGKSRFFLKKKVASRYRMPGFGSGETNDME